MSSASNILQKNLMGAEPTPKAIVGEAQLARVLSWYSCMCDKDNAREWLTSYVAANCNSKLYIVKSIPDDKLNNTMGWLARIISRGVMVHPHVTSKLSEYINRLNVADIAQPTTTKLPFDKMSIYIPVFDEAIDKLDGGFSAYKYLTSNSVPQVYANKLAEVYRPLQNEIQQAIDKADPQLVEGYRHLSRADIKSLLTYVSQIISDCQRFVGNVKKERKPRQKKAKPATAVVKKLKFLSSYPQMKLTSCSAESIIGSSILFTYNTGNNTLTVFHGLDKGLSVNRSSISNYDPAKLWSKKLGKGSEKILNTILTSPKTAAIKAFTAIHSTQNEGSDRISDRIVLLRVYK